ncbi:hypothetical protein NQ317_016717 [Molorchus minor]|uniref:Protein kinase domain-containing protein n=1 Tax=Molorchus minor TaxID=1323400 RepID=A0ABQ9J726_9CUCU|nr:hypothetical protein NQ317_016717 [Molorchus minor]
MTNSQPWTPHLEERIIKHVRIDDTKTLFEIYEFTEEIGHGSYGIVISAIEKQSLKSSAIKIVNKFTVSVIPLNFEIKILKLVDHPNIICLEKVYESPRKIYMVFERCSKNLYTVFKAKKPFSERISKKIIKQIVNAVQYLHKHDIVHRDIKMENILLTNNPDDPADPFFLKLSDFGLSIIKKWNWYPRNVKKNIVVLVFTCVTPEMLLQHTYSELCDVWAIGIILYMLLFGKYPFFSTKENELIYKICKCDPKLPPPSGIISSDVIDFIKSILQKDPVNRITAIEMIKHPWLQDHRFNGRKDESVLNYMKKWKNEIKLSSGEESDWLSAITDLDSIATISIITSVTSNAKNGVDA